MAGVAPPCSTHGCHDAWGQWHQPGTAPTTCPKGAAEMHEVHAWVLPSMHAQLHWRADTVWACMAVCATVQPARALAATRRWRCGVVGWHGVGGRVRTAAARPGLRLLGLAGPHGTLHFARSALYSGAGGGWEGWPPPAASRAEVQHWACCVCCVLHARQAIGMAQRMWVAQPAKDSTCGSLMVHVRHLPLLASREHW